MERELDNKKMWESLLSEDTALNEDIKVAIQEALQDQGLKWDGSRIVSIEDDRFLDGDVSYCSESEIEQYYSKAPSKQGIEETKKIKGGKTVAVDSKSTSDCPSFEESQGEYVGSKIEQGEFGKAVKDLMERAKGGVDDDYPEVEAEILLGIARKQIASEIDMEAMSESFERNHVDAYGLMNYRKSIKDTIKKIMEG